ncbi:MAG: hypothetical protein N2260_07430 [Syntrophobacterales bacterium]|nr:hypothetical protein [Syntrophobacterales bacterium]
MKTHKEKVVAAITGAITMYLEAERQVPIQPETLPREVIPAPMVAKPFQIPSSWVIAGRQAAMEMRRLLQMRMLR